MRTNPLELGIMLFAVILIVVAKVGERVSGNKKTKPRKSVSPSPNRGKGTGATLSWTRREAENDHDHIRSTELTYDKKLEQLKTLRSAGLLTDEEYAEKLKKAAARR